jgi:hypothetical protein
MRTLFLTIALIAGLGLASCSRQDNARETPTAREAGRDAYKASHDLKKEADKAARELKDAGKDFQQGWEEQKHATAGDRSGSADRRKEPPPRQ